jgi:hypothetical protein
MRRFLLGFLAAPVLAVLLFSSPALAFNQRITVYASVPMMRNIYVDQSGQIIKVVGNTSDNIEPRVYNELNKEIAMTDSVKNQYDQFLKQHAGHLEASKTYIVNPVMVIDAPNTQSITISPSPEKLSLSL